MKFTKQQLLDSLKAKLTENGKRLSISERTIKSLCDSHYDLLVNEETELNDLVNKVLPQYISLNGNYEKDNADFIKKWNDEHPQPTPIKKTNEGALNEPSETEKKLLERLEALEKKDAQHEAERLVSSKRNELLSMFKEKGIKDSKWSEKYLSKIAINGDTDIDKEAQDALDFYNLSHATAEKPKTPGSAGGSGNDDVDWSDVIASLNPNTGE